MKKPLFILILCLFMTTLHSQDDKYRQYYESINKDFSRTVNESNEKIRELQEEYSNYISEVNAEFAAFVAKEWALYNDFMTQELSMSLPKMKEVPIADESGLTDLKSEEIHYKKNEELPQVSDIESVNDGSNNIFNRTDSYVVKKVLTVKGVEDIVSTTPNESVSTVIIESDNVSIDFYGKRLDFNIDDKIRIKSEGVKETDVAEHFKKMAMIQEETSALWTQLDNYVKEMGLNDWGYFCILRSLSEKIFTNVDDRVLFNFFMLRNEGNFKVKMARGKDSNKLTLLAAIDNSKEVYSYSFFRFDEDDKQYKYYSIYGGGRYNESIYTYDYCEQDNTLRQMGLDFYNDLNMGACDMNRELKFEKINSTIELPYNSSHIAYLNDVPMTVFPIYFKSAISIEAQKIFNDKLNELKQQYSPVQFIDIVLNFVQTAFNYQTDEKQFGYEKYFYPEEVIAYPYSDCEDRSALFAWLVTTYTDAKVVGLQYDGHLATAVCFGDDVNVRGDMFSYLGKKYYVCDPTYINATIGMTMPQYKDKMPKIIKINK